MIRNEPPPHIIFLRPSLLPGRCGNIGGRSGITFCCGTLPVWARIIFLRPLFVSPLLGGEQGRPLASSRGVASVDKLGEEGRRRRKQEGLSLHACAARPRTRPGPRWAVAHNAAASREAGAFAGACSVPIKLGAETLWQDLACFRRSPGDTLCTEPTFCHFTAFHFAGWQRI